MSKNRLSKELARQRNAVQQQLDKSFAMEDQLQEMIRHIEGMNYELADKVKSAKKYMRVARKLYEKSKESAKRYLVKLKIKKDEKARLKDELTHVLKRHQYQEDQLIEYKAMLEQFKSSKRSLKLEVKMLCLMVAIAITVSITVSVVIAVTLANPAEQNVHRFHPRHHHPLLHGQPPPAFHHHLQQLLIVECHFTKAAVDLDTLILALTSFSPPSYPYAVSLVGVQKVTKKHCQRRH
jgi:hypothetical protein